jgi:hypothetical protein
MIVKVSKENGFGEGPRLEQGVEETEKLLRETVECLSRQHPKHAGATAAYDSLADLRPQLEEGLSALADFQQSRELTDRESSWQRAFRIVLVSRTQMVRAASHAAHRSLNQTPVPIIQTALNCVRPAARRRTSLRPSPHRRSGSGSPTINGLGPPDPATKYTRTGPDRGRQHSRSLRDRSIRG